MMTRAPAGDAGQDRAGAIVAVGRVRDDGPDGSRCWRREGGRVRPLCRTRGRSGFTLLEILIATAILTIGLASIVALFPVAINVGRQVIETSNAVVIAQSVAESVRDSMRNRKRYVTVNGNTQVYFVLRHDGVTDNVPADNRRERARDDYFILLPRHKDGRKFSGARPSDRRFKALTATKTFVYPETDRPPNGNGDAFLADNDADDDGDADPWTLRVTKTYQLGSGLFRGNPDTLPSQFVLADMREEVLKQYSFALAITPSYFDADLSGAREYMPANQLYHVRVLIYRGFDYVADAETEPPEPVYELDFEVSL